VKRWSDLMPTKIINFSIVIVMLILALLSFEALAHGVDDSTRAFLEQNISTVVNNFTA